MSCPQRYQCAGCYAKAYRCMQPPANLSKAMLPGGVSEVNLEMTLDNYNWRCSKLEYIVLISLFKLSPRYTIDVSYR